jgi:gliding motility-associated-like protein
MRKGPAHIFCLVLFPLLGGAGLSLSQTGMTASVNKYEPSCDLSSAKINVTGGVPPYSFHWSNGAIGDSVASLPDGNYTVNISDSDTSQFTPDISISFETKIACKVSFSNRFSPNGDGINDTWSVSLTEQFPKFLLQVFDRWGQVVHQQRKLYIPWDGTHLGVHVPDATYYVIFFYEEGKTSKIEKGSVTIIR